MASLDSGSKKFKAQNLNSLFLAESVATDESKEKNSPGPASQRRTSLATSRGTYRLTAMKEDAKDAGWTDDRTPEPGAKSVTTSPVVSSAKITTESGDAAGPSQSTPDAPQPQAKSQSPPAPSTEKDLAAASGFDMGNEPFNWDEEEDSWQPPTVSSAQVISQVSGAAPSPSPKPKAPEPAPWLKKKAPVSAEKSLQERIAELKLSKSGKPQSHPRHIGHGDSRSHYPSYAHPPHVPHNQPPGLDSLSRFRIRGDPAELDSRHRPRFGRQGPHDDFGHHGRHHDDFGYHGRQGHNDDFGHHGRQGHHDDFGHHSRSDRGYRDPLDEIDSWRRPAPRAPPVKEAPLSAPPASNPAPSAAPSAPPAPAAPAASGAAPAAPAAPFDTTKEADSASASAPAAPAPVAPWATMRKKEQEEVMRDARLRLQARKDADKAERKEKAARLQARIDELALKKAQEEAERQKEKAMKERKRMEEERRERSAQLEREFAEKLRIENEKAKKAQLKREAKKAGPKKPAVPKGNAVEPLPHREDISPYLLQFLEGAPTPGPGFGGFNKSRLLNSDIPPGLPIHSGDMSELGFMYWPETEEQSDAEEGAEEPALKLPKLARFTHISYKRGELPVVVDKFEMASNNTFGNLHRDRRQFYVKPPAESYTISSGWKQYRRRT